MINHELVDYIQKAREKNIGIDSIIFSLKKAGWSEDVIKESNDAASLVVPTPPIPQPVQQKTHIESTHHITMWDSFEHILLFISLYVTAISFALILHYFVDKYLPRSNDLYSTGTYSMYNYPNSWQDNLLRGYLSALIVSFPIFTFLFIRITGSTIKFPYLRMLKSRIVLIYITLTLTFIIMLANIISIVNGLLNGNTTLNFIAHFLVTIGVSGSIFGYYLRQVKGDRKSYE